MLNQWRIFRIFWDYPDTCVGTLREWRLSIWNAVLSSHILLRSRFRKYHQLRNLTEAKIPKMLCIDSERLCLNTNDCLKITYAIHKILMTYYFLVLIHNCYFMRYVSECEKTTICCREKRKSLHFHFELHWDKRKDI